MRLPLRFLNFINHLVLGTQGDYFFPLLLSFIRLKVKEISDVNNIANIIIIDIAWYVSITPPPFS